MYMSPETEATVADRPFYVTCYYAYIHVLCMCMV